MNETKYHLFKVYDYKGGELSPSINLSKVELIEDILESFINTDSYFNKESFTYNYLLNTISFTKTKTFEIN